MFVVLDSREADRRLALAGVRRATVAATRLLLALLAAGVATTVSLLVTATVFDPVQGAAHAAGNSLVAATYAFVGMLLGPVFGRVSSVFLAFLIPRLRRHPRRHPWRSHGALRRGRLARRGAGLAHRPRRGSGRRGGTAYRPPPSGHVRQR